MWKNCSYKLSFTLQFKAYLTCTYFKNNLEIIALLFNKLFKKLIWNGNAYLFFNKCDVPFRMLATIGGARFLRGYYRGRFRDNNMMVLQQEVRMPIYKWLGVAIFGGVGSVANKITDFAKNELHYDYGV